MFSLFSTFSAFFARGDPFSPHRTTPDPLPPHPLSSSSAVAAALSSDSYRKATMLLRSGSVDTFVAQPALYPSSSWWLR